MKRAHLLVIGSLLLFFNQGAFAQDKSYFSELVPPSPDVAQLGTYGATNVGKYTGTANISVPLHSINFEGLQIPVALSYATGGIKVSQEASWVGLGWNLSANAVITRQINNYDDLISGEGARGYLYSPSYNYPISSSQETALFNAYNSSLPHDTEPDLFTANVFGESVQFLLPKKGVSNTVEAKVLNSKILKVYYYVSTKTFKVVNGRGYEFYFGNGSNDVSKEFTTSYRSDGSPASTDAHALASSINYQTSDGGRTRHKITAWHVDRVVAPTGREITFTYQKAFYFGYPNFSDNYDFNMCTPNGSQGTVGYLNYDATYRKVTCNITGFESIHLKKIEGDFGSIDFTLADRSDISSRYQTATSFNTQLNSSVFNNKIKRLTGITVKNQKNETIKTIGLQQSYFNSDKSSDTGTYKKEKYLRLKLDGVTVNDQTYAFEYISPNGLPAKDSKSEDFWGYYNGKSNTTRIPSFGRLVLCNINNREFYFNMEGANKGSDINYGKIGLISKVVYPTKGHTEFGYETNKALVDKPSVDPANPFQNSTDYSYNYQYLRRSEFNDFNQSINENEIFEITTANTLPFAFNFEVSVNITCGFNCSGGLNTNQNVIEIENVDTGAKLYLLKYNGTGVRSAQYNLPNGRYRMKKLNHTQTPGGAALFATVTKSSFIDASDDNSQPFQEFNVGGARIKTVTNYDSDNSFISKKQYNYTNQFGTSSGILMNELVYHSKYGVYDYSPQNFLGVFTMTSGTPLSLEFSAQGSHIGYGTVEEQDVDTNGVTKGKISTAYVNEKNEFLTKYIGTTFEIHQQYYNDYNNLPGYDDVHYGNAYLLGVTPISYNYKNGNVLNENIDDSSGDILRYSTTTFNDVEVTSTPIYRAHFSPGGLVTDYGYEQTGDLFLPNVSESRSYFGNNYVTTTNTTTYNSYFLPRSTVTTTSENNVTVKQETFYPFDSNYGVSNYPYMSNLRSLNRITEPVLTRTYENNTLLSQTLFKFGSFSGKYWRTEALEAKGTDALTQRMDFISYDIRGNLTQYKQTNGASTVYVWGYNSMYPVAKIENATYSQITATGVNLSTINNINTSDASMRTELNKIRNGLPNSLVTTYTYKQGVGISSMTDPKGYVMYYEYDASNRLETVKDADNNIVSHNKYHYKGN